MLSVAFVVTLLSIQFALVLPFNGDPVKRLVAVVAPVPAVPAVTARPVAPVPAVTAATVKPVTAATVTPMTTKPVPPVTAATVKPVPPLPPVTAVKPVVTTVQPPTTRFWSSTTSKPGFWCDAVKNPGVKVLNITLNRGAVQGNASCNEQVFELPSDDDYEIVAYEAIVDKPEDVFYLIMYQCDAAEYTSPMSLPPTHPPKPIPTSCSLIGPCTTAAMFWAPSSFTQRCHDSPYSMWFGKNYFSTTVLRAYYNNPNLKNGVFDNSGFRLYYQRKSRPNNVGLVVFGQQDIALPPRTEKCDVFGRGFDGNCSRNALKGRSSYSVLSVQFLTHDKGTYGSLSLVKQNGQNVTLFDSKLIPGKPATRLFQPSTILMAPGDTIRSQCSYNTLSTNNWTYFGEYGLDEMCYQFVELSPPVPHIHLHFSNFLNDVGKLTMCDALPPFNINGCDGNKFVETVSQSTYGPLKLDMVKSCVCSEAARPTACSSQCYEYLIQSGLMRNPCITTDEALQSLAAYWLGSTSEIYRVKVQMDLCRALPSAPRSGISCVA